MNNHQKVILGAGAVGAFLLYQSKKTTIDPKTGKPVKKTGLLSNLLPARGTNSPYVASTNMATRNGTASAPRPPSSGLGYGNTARGVAQPPTTAGAIALGASGVLSSLLNFLGRKPTAPATSTAQQRPSAGSSGGGMSGGGMSGGGGGGGRSPGMGGAAGVAAGGGSDSSTPVQSGSFDENGNWIADSETPIVGGAFDENGNWISDSETPITSGSFDENGNFLSDSETPIIPGAFDENGNWNPDEDPAAETLSADPLDSTPIGNGDFTGTIGFDPGMFDSADPSSGMDDSGFAAVDASVDDFANAGGGGGGEDYGTNWWDE